MVGFVRVSDRRRKVLKKIVSCLRLGEIPMRRHSEGLFPIGKSGMRLLFVLLLCNSVLLCYCMAAEWNLEMVQTMWRHGHRTPLTALPKFEETWLCHSTEAAMAENTLDLDQYPPNRVFLSHFIPGVESLPGNCSVGQLTLQGQEDMQQTGKILANRYAGFLPTAYDPAAIYIRTTPTPRCQNSARILVNTLFPATATDGLVHLYMREQSMENMESNANICPMFYNYQSDVQYSAAYTKTITALTQWRQYIQSIFQSSDPNFPNFTNLLDAFTCRLSANMTLPPGINQTLYEALLEQVTLQGQLMNGDPKVAKASVGNFFNEIMDAFELKVSNTSSPLKFIGYSAHDSGIWPIALQLGIGKEWPAIAGDLSFELYSSTTSADTFAMRIMYQNAMVQLPGCSEYCEMSEFSSKVASLRLPHLHSSFCTG